ncbi:hypothetical protein FY130_05940 [Agrobacterium pusense]|nr:hypothetical protein FY130_05940 [Agrobacterium pusense]
MKAHNGTPGASAVPGGVTLYSMKAASLYSDTSMASRPTGTAVGQDRDGNARVYGGCSTALYKLSPSTRQWTNISRPTGYQAADKERWRSVEFGSLQIFTNFSDEPQFINMNQDIQFANLTSLVKGRFITTHKGFVIMGNTFDSLDGAVPYRVRWSGIESPSDWTFNPSTQADFQDIHGNGSIMGLVSDDNVWVIFQRGIVQMQYVGAPYVFSFTDRVVGKGCSVAESVISVEGGRHFFLSDDGFYMFQSGSLTPIGAGRIDKWFLQNADPDKLHLMSVASDPRETLIFWSFCSINSPNSKPDMMLVYNYVTGQWSTADATADMIFNSLSLPWTIDQLDSFGVLDDLPASFDDPLWSGGKAMLWAMSNQGEIYSFSGPTLELSVETPEYQLSKIFPNQTGADIALITKARPLFEGEGTAHLQVGTRRLLSNPIQWSTLKETNVETGFAYFREKSRYQRLRVRISGDWKTAFAVQIDGQTAGKR